MKDLAQMQCVDIMKLEGDFEGCENCWDMKDVH